MVETLVGFAVLMIIFSFVVVIFNMVMSMIGESRMRAVALGLAQERSEQVRNLPFNNVGTVGGIISGTLFQSQSVNRNGQDYLIKTDVVYIDDPFDGNAPVDLIPTDYKRVRVEVSWSGAFASRQPVTIVADVMPNGLETLVGGGVLYISVINASGLPVGGATVKVDNTTVVPEIHYETVSDINGKVMLPGAKSCNECYSVVVTKNSYSTDRTYSITEVTNPLKPSLSIIEGQVTSVSFAIDQTSTISVLTTGPRENNYIPFSGVQFNIKGSRVIGYDASDQPVYKYNQSHSSLTGGLISISNLEWDNYEIFIAEPSSVDMAGSYPISPFPLNPGQTVNVTLVTTAATTNNLLVIAKDIANRGIATASVTLKRTGFIASKSAGVSGKGDQGQVIFNSLVPAKYDLLIKHPDYLTATASTTIMGDTKLPIVLEHNP